MNGKYDFIIEICFNSFVITKLILKFAEIVVTSVKLIEYLDQGNEEMRTESVSWPVIGQIENSLKILFKRLIEIDILLYTLNHTIDQQIMLLHCYAGKCLQFQELV